jgi:hypothetical protein
MRALQSALPHFGPQPKTYAASPVWRGSAQAKVKFAPLAKRQAVKIWHDARRFERQTRGTIMLRAGCVSRRDGRLGRAGLAVLHALIFDFLNYASGRLDPSYEAIAHRACYSVRSVARALAKLRAAGVVDWVRRCAGRMDGDRYVLEQETNAYGISAAGSWPGYRRNDPPPPQPGTWGDHPPIVPAIEAAAIELAHRQGRAAIGALESDPVDALAQALAKLARRRAP